MRILSLSFRVNAVGEDSGFATFEARTPSNAKKTAGVHLLGGQGEEPSLSDWITPRRSIEVSTSATPKVREEVAEECLRSKNPFVDTKDKQVHCELLSFATKSPSVSDSLSVEQIGTEMAGPWGLKRDTRVVGGEGVTAKGTSRRPNIIPDRYSGKIQWNDYHDILRVAG